MHAFLLSANLKKHMFNKNITIMSNSLDLDQGVHFAGPDLGPICLQRSSADNLQGESLSI